MEAEGGVISGALMVPDRQIKRELDYLNSQEGTIQYWMERTYLPRERVERIYEAGIPHPLLDFENPTVDREILVGAFRGEIKTQDGINIDTYLNAHADMLQLDLAEMERKFAAYEAAVERGETPEPLSIPPHLKGSSEVRDHLKEVAKLSGESMETIEDIYLAEIARWQRLFQLLGQISVLKAKEEND